MLTELDNDEIDLFLAMHSLGQLGCSLEGKPFIFPMAYVYNDDTLYGQTTTGSKVEIVRHNPVVCFQVHEVTEQGWTSVMCWGRFEELDFHALEEQSAEVLTSLLSRKIGTIQNTIGVEVPFRHNHTIVPGKVDNKVSTVFRIVVNEKSGRRWRAP